MFQKDKSRGARRWRSFCVWMRRLRRDWNDHGWKQDPIYDYRWIGNDRIFCGIRGTTLCNCFNLTSRDALRFKDTPHGRCSKYECNPRTKTHGLESKPIQEWRSEEVEREDWHVRHHRDGSRLMKVACLRCGIMLRKELVAFGKRNSKWEGHSECAACRKTLEEKTRYWRNGIPVEF